VSPHELVFGLLGGKPLGAEAESDVMLERLRRGLPYRAFERVRETLQIDSARMQQIVGLPTRTLARRKVERQFTKEESDRLYRLARIAALATDVLGDGQRAVDWLRADNRALGDSAPVDQLDTDFGAQRVEQLLGRIDHGIFG
jgi:putative toxin-antitoxin system antitoxin component (TIGR02293 family)